MKIAIIQALLMYGIACIVAMSVALMIKGVFKLVRRFSRSS